MSNAELRQSNIPKGLYNDYGNFGDKESLT